MAMLASSDNAEAARLLRPLSVTVDEKQVTVDWRAAADDVWNELKNIQERGRHGGVRFGFGKRGARGYLGVTVTEGNLVMGVESGSPAEAAGIAKGDRIVKIDGKEIAGRNDIVAALAHKSAGDLTRVSVDRGGQQRDFTVKVRLIETGSFSLGPSGDE